MQVLHELSYMILSKVHLEEATFPEEHVVNCLLHLFNYLYGIKEFRF